MVLIIEDSTLHFFFFFSDKQAKERNSKSGKQKGKSNNQSASPHEDKDGRNNLIGSMSFNLNLFFVFI